jgi:nucleotide-binding universal stress UspA family protein
LILVKGASMKPAMKRILVATDGSDGSNRALDAAAELAGATGAALTIVTIGGNLTGADLRKLADRDGDLSKSLQAQADKPHLLHRRGCALTR